MKIHIYLLVLIISITLSIKKFKDDSDELQNNNDQNLIVNSFNKQKNRNLRVTKFNNKNYKKLAFLLTLYLSIPTTCQQKLLPTKLNTRFNQNMCKSISMSLNEPTKGSKLGPKDQNQNQINKEFYQYYKYGLKPFDTKLQYMFTKDEDLINEGSKIIEDNILIEQIKPGIDEIDTIKKLFKGLHDNEKYQINNSIENESEKNKEIQQPEIEQLQDQFLLDEDKIEDEVKDLYQQIQSKASEIMDNDQKMIDENVLIEYIKPDIDDLRLIKKLFKQSREYEKDKISKGEHKFNKQSIEFLQDQNLIDEDKIDEDIVEMINDLNNQQKALANVNFQSEIIKEEQKK